MLVRTAPDAYDKLRLLGGMAGDDVLSEDAARRFNMLQERLLPVQKPRHACRSLQGDYARRQDHFPDAGYVHRRLQIRLLLLPQQHLGAPQAVRVQGG